MSVKCINKVIRIFLTRFKGYCSLIIIINAYYVILTFIIIIVNVSITVRLRINNNYCFKILFININKLWF